MLVLSREPGEDVRIGHDITVRVVEIRGGKVRLAFDAPLDVHIHRSEVYDAIERKEKRQNESEESNER